MVPLNNKKRTVSGLYIVAALLLLGIGLFWGLTGGLQYLIPGFLKESLSFEKVRPLHVSSVVFWIILGAMGAVLTYLQQHTGRQIYSHLILKMQLLIFIFSIIAILISYCIGMFGGREYWEYPPLLALPITIGWIFFLINFIKSVKSFRKQPVYVWMWLTGIVFFLFTFLESYLWIFPYFRNNIVTDMTVQWKSYGSMVGSWNMLIYGSSIFLMDKINNNKTYSHSNIAFILYFTGLFNLMFNWGHHIYTLPTYAYIKHISYAVSMTELFILGRIILKWKSSVSIAKKNFHLAAYRFLIVADVWVFLTLLLALFMSIPGINLYTHGTHITVAHTMGATIGINSFLLLAIAFDILNDTCRSFVPYKKIFNNGYWLASISLLVFWISLIGAGIIKAKWQLSTPQTLFSDMMLKLRPFFIAFFIAGTAMTTGFLLIIYPLLKNQLLCYFKKNSKEKKITGYYPSATFRIE